MAVSNEARKSVVFFGKQVPPEANAKSEHSINIRYGGTGFLASYMDHEGHSFGYLVTCRHVAEQLDIDFFVRMNTVVGTSEDCPVENANWEFHPDETVDIAATTISVNALHFDQLTVPLSKSAKRNAIACGQRIHIVGLFRLHYGKKRNIPIVHTGHLAALADPHEKIAIRNRATGRQVLAESYLVEAQTLEGLSGSPVFVQEYVSSYAELTDQAGSISNQKVGMFGPMTLLGVYQGAWDANPGEILAEDRNLNGNRRIPLGMGIVVPIERVIELIDGNDNFKERRQQKK